MSTKIGRRVCFSERCLKYTFPQSGIRLSRELTVLRKVPIPSNYFWLLDRALPILIGDEQAGTRQCNMSSEAYGGSAINVIDLFDQDVYAYGERGVYAPEVRDR